MRATITIPPALAATLGALAGIAAARAPSPVVLAIAIVLATTSLVGAALTAVNALGVLRHIARTERVQRDAVNAYLAEQRRHHAECHGRTNTHAGVN